MAKTTFLLMRHGQSVGNVANKFVGHIDVPLTELGKAQARAVAESMRGQQIDAIYASDLMRARMTAQPFSEIFGIPVNPSRTFREVYVGEWEGVYIPDLRRKFPYEFGELWSKQFGLAVTPGGETPPEAAERFLGGLREVAAVCPGKTVLVCAHAAVIRAVYATVLGLPPERWDTTDWPNNASLSTVEYEDGVFRAGRYSDDSALRAAGIDTPTVNRKKRYDTFEKSLGYLVAESVAKIGACDCPMSFHYPVTTFDSIFSIEIDEIGKPNDLDGKLAAFAADREPILGRVRYEKHGEKILVTVPAKGVLYLADKYPATALLKKIVRLVRDGGDKREVHAAFDENGAAYLPSPDDEFDEVILPEGEDKGQVFCFSYTPATEYHRFLRADFENLFPNVLPKE